VQRLAEDVQAAGSGSFPAKGSFVFTNPISTNFGGYDLAEDYTTDDLNLRPGELVASSGGSRVARTTRAYDPHLLGVVSTEPGFVLSQKTRTGVLPIALIGRAPVQVSAANGPIAVGDALTASDLPGVAMKATAPGPTLGIALEPYPNASPPQSADTVGAILCFISLGERSPNVAEAVRTLQAENTQLRTELKQLRDAVDALTANASP